MAKSTNIRRPRPAQTRPTTINVDIKINILHTIADAIYATSAGKVREAVANSRDNDASWVIIVLDQTNRRLSVLDNGSGISRERFKEIFDNIGYGLLGEKNGDKLSFFGLGLMSIFQLGKGVKVFTKHRDKSELLCLEIDSGEIFDRKNRYRSIRDLSKFIHPLRVVEPAERRKASLDITNRILSEGKIVSLPASYTEIIIEGIDSGITEDMASSQFRTELEQLLPLRPRDTGKETEPFLDRFSRNAREELTRILQDARFSRTVDVYYGVQEELQEPIEIPQLWKYFPKFNSQITFPDDNVRIGISEMGDFAYYVVHTVGDDLQREQDAEIRETGFWIRNQNFLVKSNDFLDKPGPGRKPAGTIDRPLRNWVFGEIFHRNMNSFLTVSRNDFLYEDESFLDFRMRFLREVASPVNRSIREVWEKRKPILDHFVIPFSKIADSDGPIAKVESRLRTLLGEGKSEREFHEEAKALLRRNHSADIEDDTKRVDTILFQKKAPLIVGEDEDAIVKIVPTLAKTAGTHEARWDSKSQKVVVDVSPTLFAPRQMVFLGETYQVFYVACRESDRGVSINVDTRQIYVNPFNGDLRQFSVNILDVYVAIEIADAVSATKGDMKRNFLRIIGATPCPAAKYVGPLGDDLRRSLVYRG